MKAKYNRSAVAAQNIMRRTARENGVTYEHVYREIEVAILHGLSSSEPETIKIWAEIKRKAKKEIPTPEDVIIHATTETVARMFSPSPTVQFKSQILQ